MNAARQLPDEIRRMYSNLYPLAGRRFTHCRRFVEQLPVVFVLHVIPVVLGVAIPTRQSRRLPILLFLRIVPLPPC